MAEAWIGRECVSCSEDAAIVRRSSPENPYDEVVRIARLHYQIGDTTIAGCGQIETAACSCHREFLKCNRSERTIGVRRPIDTQEGYWRYDIGKRICPTAADAGGRRDKDCSRLCGMNNDLADRASRKGCCSYHAITSIK